jgi:Putative sensor
MVSARPAVLAADQRDDCLLTLRHNPIGLLFSASLWRSAGYLLGYLLVSGPLFAVALTSITAAVVLSITVVAIPLLIAAAYAIRGCAGLERVRLRPVFAEPVLGHYPSPERGLWRQTLGRWREGTTWRDLAYVIGLWPVLFTLDCIVLSIWFTFVAGIALPLWYSHASDMCLGDCTVQHAPGAMIGYFPHGPLGPGHGGLYVDSLSRALLAAAGFAVLFLLFNYALVAAARLQAQAARAILGRPSDPLAAARAVLAGPRPLGPLLQSDPPGPARPRNDALSG